MTTVNLIVGQISICCIPWQINVKTVSSLNKVSSQILNWKQTQPPQKNKYLKYLYTAQTGCNILGYDGLTGWFTGLQTGCLAERKQKEMWGGGGVFLMVVVWGGAVRMSTKKCFFFLKKKLKMWSSKSRIEMAFCHKVTFREISISFQQKGLMLNRKRSACCFGSKTVKVKNSTVAYETF